MTSTGLVTVARPTCVLSPATRSPGGDSGIAFQQTTNGSFRGARSGHDNCNVAVQEGWTGDAASDEEDHYAISCTSFSYDQQQLELFRNQKIAKDPAPPSTVICGLEDKPSKPQAGIRVQPPPGFEHLGARILMHDEAGDYVVDAGTSNELSFKRRKWPEKASGQSILTQSLRQDKANEAERMQQPPPGFEHLGPIPKADYVPPTEHSLISPTEKPYLPAPELWHRCSENHTKADRILPLLERIRGKAPRAQKSTAAPAQWQSRQKQSKMQSCVDCIYAPYQSTEWHDPDDFILFDELHQIATF